MEVYSVSIYTIKLSHKYTWINMDQIEDSNTPELKGAVKGLNIRFFYAQQWECASVHEHTVTQVQQQMYMSLKTLWNSDI